jgi:CheY-like chemotaxis protein
MIPVVALAPLHHRAVAHDLGTRRVQVVVKPVRERELLAAIVQALRAEEVVVPNAGEGSAAPAVDEAQRAPSRSLRILLVEDNAVNLRFMQLQLQKFGYDAVCAANGLEALAAVEQAAFDLVFMDCQMPEMDGYEATRRLRRDPRSAGLRIVALTANAMAGDRDKCLAAGMDDYLAKPVREPELRSVLQRAIDGRAAETANN